MTTSVLHESFKAMSILCPSSETCHTLVQASSDLAFGPRGDRKRLEELTRILYLHYDPLDPSCLDECRCSQANCSLLLIHALAQTTIRGFLISVIKEASGPMVEWALKVLWRISCLRRIVSKCSSKLQTPATSPKGPSSIFSGRSSGSSSRHDFNQKDWAWGPFVELLQHRYAIPEIAVHTLFEIAVGKLRLPKKPKTDFYHCKVHSLETFSLLLDGFVNHTIVSARTTLDILNVLFTDSKFNLEIFYRSPNWQKRLIPFFKSRDLPFLQDGEDRDEQDAIHIELESTIFRLNVTVITRVHYHIFKAKKKSFKSSLKETRTCFEKQLGWNEEASASYRVLLYSLAKKMQSESIQLQMDYSTAFWDNLNPFFETLENYVFFDPVSQSENRDANKSGKSVGLHFSSTGTCLDVILILESLNVLQNSFDISYLDPLYNQEIRTDSRLMQIGSHLKKRLSFFKNAQRFFFDLESGNSSNADILSSLAGLLEQHKRNRIASIFGVGKQASSIERQLSVMVKAQKAMVMTGENNRGVHVISQAEFLDNARRKFSNVSMAQQFCEDKRTDMFRHDPELRALQLNIGRGSVSHRLSAPKNVKASARGAKANSTMNFRKTLMRPEISVDESSVAPSQALAPLSEVPEENLSREPDNMREMAEPTTPFSKDSIKMDDVTMSDGMFRLTIDEDPLEHSASDIESIKSLEDENTSDDEIMDEDAVWARALYDFTPTDDNEVTFVEGDLLEVLQEKESGWWLVAVNDQLGYAPSNYLEVLEEFELDDDNEATISSEYFDTEDMDATQAAMADLQQFSEQITRISVGKHLAGTNKEQQEIELSPDLIPEVFETSGKLDLFQEETIEIRGEPELSCGYCGIKLDPGNFFEQDGIICCEKDLLRNYFKCSSCNEPIEGDYIEVGSTKMHAHCARCSVCKIALESDDDLNQKNGELFCKKHFAKRFGVNCAHCDEVMVEAHIIALGKTWHKHHFMCSGKCGVPIIGDFLVSEGKPYCTTDYAEDIADKCAACGEPVLDISLGVDGLAYHKNCVNCKSCGIVFDEESCSDFVPLGVEGGRHDFMCLEHYKAENITECNQCHKVIPVFEERVEFQDAPYHAGCVICSYCDKNLIGETTIFRESDQFYCQEHYEELLAPKCDICKGVLRENGVGLLGMQAHASCITCDVCNQELIGTGLGIHQSAGGRLLCKEHYILENAKICKGCSKPIIDKMLTVKEDYYHPECLTCSVCSVNLSGQRFGFKGEELRCVEHIRQ